MASETFVSALLLVTGVVAAAILIVAVLPVLWGMVGTFSSSSAATDKSMRTDFKIVTTFAKYAPGAVPPPWAGVCATIWMKNIGTARIGTGDLNLADVYFGKSDNFGRGTLNSPPGSAISRNLQYAIPWNYSIKETTTNNVWEPGETVEVNAFFPYPSTLSGQPMYFQFTLPGAVSRSTEFTAI